jgi:pumilio RNA-binding family
MFKHLLALQTFLQPVSSALLTPTDLSPGRFFDVKLRSPYEHPYLSPPSILFENGSPVKDRDSLVPNLPAYHAPLVQINHARTQPGANIYPFFEPFAG